MSEDYKRGYQQGWRAALNDALGILLAVLAGRDPDEIRRELGIV